MHAHFHGASVKYFMERDELGECLSIRCKKLRAMFVFTFLLKGGLNHITFLCRFFLLDDAVSQVLLKIKFND